MTCDDAPVTEPNPPWKLRFWAIFTGQAISLLGSALTQFVLLWWIADSTESVTALAAAGMASLLPQALLTPIGGTVADRYSRRLVMILADLVSAICMVVLIALFLTGRVELWHVFVMMSIRSAMQAFQQPAAAASAAMLVPAEFLPRVAGLNQSLTGMTMVAAAPLGALAMGLMPMGWALGIDVVTAVLGIVPLLIFAIPQDKPPGVQRRGFWREFQEGVLTVWTDPLLRRLYALLTAVVVVIMPSFTLVPLLVKGHFNGGPAEVAILESLSGLGMIAGGAIVALLVPARPMLWVMFGFAAACFSMALGALAPGNMFWLAVVWWGLSSLAFVLGSTPVTVLLQTTVPNHLQGRVLSLMTTLMGLAAPVGLAIATPLGEVIGVRWLFVVLGAAGGLVALLGLMSRSLRNATGSGGKKA